MFGESSLLIAASNGQFSTTQYFLEHCDASILEGTKRKNRSTVWDLLEGHWDSGQPAEVTALLRAMVVRGAPTASLVNRVRPEYAPIVLQGARLWAGLPAYLAQRRALLAENTSLIAPLRALVSSYEEPTTTEELWATGLGALP
jgi:hypothetical protein